MAELLSCSQFTFHVVSITVPYRSHPTIGFSPKHPAIKMDHTMTYVTGSYRSRQPASTQTISFKIQPDPRKFLADRGDIR